jgi:hypothetical protein
MGVALPVQLIKLIIAIEDKEIMNNVLMIFAQQFISVSQLEVWAMESLNTQHLKTAGHLMMCLSFIFLFKQLLHNNASTFAGYGTHAVARGIITDFVSYCVGSKGVINPVFGDGRIWWKGFYLNRILGKFLF